MGGEPRFVQPWRRGPLSTPSGAEVEILAVIIGVESLVILALLCANVLDRRARASAWRRIADARRSRNPS